MSKIQFIALFLVIFLLTIISSTTAQFTPIALMAACLQEHETNPSVLITRETSPQVYEHLNYQWNQRLGQIEPLGILVAGNTQDVSNGIICAGILNIRIIPKSGGHSFEKYSHGNNETIVIDLVNLHSITVDKNSLTAEAGAGVLLSHLYSKIWNEARLGIPAGTCVSVGAAISLGAGYGHVAHIYGVTSDNVLEVEIVDATGQIRIVNETSNADIFWALRGAGAGNFGIVTKLKYQLFDAADMNFTHIYIRFSDLSEYNRALDFWFTWNSENINGTTTGLAMVQPTEIILIFVDINMSQEKIDSIIKDFPEHNVEIKQFNFIEMIVQASWPHVEADDLDNVKRQDHPKSPYKAKSYYSSKIITSEELQIFERMLTKIPSGVIVHFNSYGGAISRVPKDQTSFVHRDSLYSILIEITVEGDSVDSWVEEIDKFVIEVLDNGESCQNFNDGTLDNYLERYYGSNLDRLIEIKRSVDPRNVFHYPQSIPLVRE